MSNHIVASRHDFQILSLDLTLLFLRKASNAIFRQMLGRGSLLIFGDIKGAGLPQQRARGTTYISTWIPGTISNYSRVIKYVERNKKRLSYKKHDVFFNFKRNQLNYILMLNPIRLLLKKRSLLFLDVDEKKRIVYLFLSQR